MKKTLIKSILALSLFLFSGILLVGCTTQKSINKTYILRYYDEVNAIGKSPSVLSLMPANETYVGFLGEFMVSEDSDYYYFYSLLSEKKFTSCKKNYLYHLFDTDLDSYLVIEDDNNRSIIYDHLGNMLLDYGIYSDLSIRLDSLFIPNEKDSSLQYQEEWITYSLSQADLKKETKTIHNLLSFKEEDGAIYQFTRELFDYSKIKGCQIGDLYSNNGDSLTAYGLKGYSFKETNDIDFYSIRVMNNKGKIVSLINIDYLSTMNHFLMGNGFILVQYTNSVESEAVEYDYFDDTKGKFLLNTYSINLKNGEKKELKNFPYLIQDSSKVFATTPDGDKVISHFLVEANPIKNKLMKDSEYISIKADGTILYTKTECFSSITRLDDTHNLVKSPYGNYVEKNHKPLFFLESNSIIGSQMIAVKNDGNYSLINFDGKYINDKIYSSLSLSNEKTFLYIEASSVSEITYHDNSLFEKKIEHAIMLTYLVNQAGTFIYQKSLQIEASRDQSNLYSLTIKNIQGTTLKSYDKLTSYEFQQKIIGSNTYTFLITKKDGKTTYSLVHLF